MNRPFYAIGVLLAFLALAMLAVGLSSRPRPLAAPPQGVGPSAAGSGTQAPRHQPGPTAYVLIVPNAPTEEPAFEVPAVEEPVVEIATTDQPTYEQGCGWDRETGLVYLPIRTPAVELRGVRVEMARDPSQWTGPQGDLRTGYDRDYDRAMNPALSPERPSRVLSYQPAEDDELVQRFQSLLPRSTSRVMPAGRRHWEFELQTIYLGIINRLERYIDAPVAAAAGQRGPTWSDYRAWIEPQQAAVAERNIPASAGAFWGQPQDQVLQIAVSALNRVAEMLHAAVLRLVDGATERLARRTDAPSAVASPK